MDFAGIPVFILFGPTASGKTAVLERLLAQDGAEVISAEIISADSMQVYRGMDIGTAKPSAALREKIPHHLIDIRSPDEQFNAGDFVRLAQEAIVDCAARGKLPVVSGGTGFYINNLVSGLPEAPPSDEALRAALKAELCEKGAAALMEELAACDKTSAARIHINDTYRLLRALEVFRLTGRPLSSFNVSSDAGSAATKNGNAPKFDFFIAGLERAREELYRRINKRVAQFLKDGLYDEVKQLYSQGFTPDCPGLKAIGYREFFYKADGGGKWQLNDIGGPGGAARLADIEASIAQNSRNYAKRQLTYFKKLPNTHWYFLED